MGRGSALNQSSRWVRVAALFLTGVMLALLPPLAGFGWGLESAIAQQNRTMPTDRNACAVLTAPLTPAEQEYAKTAWQYFAKNYQPDTGFVNATGGYPSGTLWDMGNYLVALNTARWLNLISQKEFDEKLNKFLSALGSLKLFDDALPNKVYNAANGQMVDYGNNPSPRGIGWSALDIGRVLAAFHIIRTCHPQYADWLKGIIQRWQIARSLQDDQLYGATVTPDGKTMLVQEGRLGYEEYAVRGYELWGYKADKAKSFQPFQFVDIYGVQIPVDLRDYQRTNANNYVVSESYILDGIEFGWQGELADYAGRVLEAQRRRYSRTGQLTAVTEDNIDAPPYFIYNTVYSNGVPWAAITDQNQPIPQFRSISTKAAFGWHYLYPSNEYAQKVFDAVKDLRSPKNDGFYAGLYEATQKPNTSLTGNTNGLILEILYYKARGNRPLIGQADLASTSVTPPPIAPVDVSTKSSTCSRLSKPLSLVERRYAQAAWQYFRANAQATGLINDRSDFKGVTLWGLGDYLAALRAARTLEVITPEDFDQRIRQLFGTIRQLPLYGGELPNRGYDPWSLQPVDYGGNPMPNGTGWSAADLGRFLSALYGLKTCYPEYADAADRIVLDWSYVRVVRDRVLYSGTVTQDEAGRMLTRTLPETRLGYSEYTARAFQLWGFEVDRVAVGGQYAKANVEGFEVPTQRQGMPKTSALSITVSEPFLLYGLEFGFDPQMRSLAEPLFKAQAERFRRTQQFTAANTTAINSPPYILHSTLVGNGQAWANLDAQGNPAKGDRLVSTSVAFALYALFPDESYSRELWQTVTDLYNPQLGYYEGFYETSGKRENNQAANTNSLILQALLYRATNTQPLLRPAVMESPWWKAIASGDTSRGLPSQKQQTATFVTEGTQTYWVTTNPVSAMVPEQSLGSTEPIPVPAPFPLPAVPQPTPQPTATAAQSATILPSPRPIPSPALPESTSPQPKPEVAQPTKVVPIVSSERDAIAAKRAWKYFERNWNQQTGLVNAVDQFAWTTLWDQGSALLGIHAGRQLGLMTAERFDQRLSVMLKTLETLPIPVAGLPNKAYSTSTAQMRQLDDTPDPNGSSGWSVLDTARFLVGLHVMRQHYPEYGDRIHRIVKRWQLTKLVKNGELIGGISTPQGIQRVQEGRLGYEQYAAYGLKLWGLEATQALHYPPSKTIKVDGVSLQVDQRELKNSGASNYLTSDPYLLWGLELGWTETVKPQVQNLFKVQAQRYQRTKIVTAVNEDSIDRPPYFLYYSVYANGQPWHAINVQGKAFPHLRFVSTKAAFAWSLLMQKDSYAKVLRDTVQNLADPVRGYFSGRYEDSSLGKNISIDVNTNAIILESLLYKARGEKPLAL
jgi:hypothetical protein